MTSVGVQVEYWKGKLSGVRSLQLPSDFIRKPVHGCSRGGWVDIVIPENVVRPLAAFAATSSVTMYMLLLSSLQLLLRAYSRHDDVVVSHCTFSVHLSQLGMHHQSTQVM